MGMPTSPTTTPARAGSSRGSTLHSRARASRPPTVSRSRVSNLARRLRRARKAGRPLVRKRPFRRRSKEELDKARKFAIEGFAESLLPVCDSLEMALTVESPSVDSIREGVQATLRQLQQALERNKVQVIDPLGQRFDPNTQQAISMQPNPEVAANHVAAVLQKGYLINDRVLRPAMVVVSQG